VLQARVKGIAGDTGIITASFDDVFIESSEKIFSWPILLSSNSARKYK